MAPPAPRPLLFPEDFELNRRAEAISWLRLRPF
jgi:hypothetical protein